MWFEFDQSDKPFDDSSLSHTRFTDNHRGIGALAVAEYLDHLLDLGFTSDCRRELVLAREFIQGNAEMFKIDGKFVFFPEMFCLFFARPDTLGNLFGCASRVDPQPPEDLCRNTVRIGEKRSEEHTSELQSLRHLVCRLL